MNIEDITSPESILHRPENLLGVLSRERMYDVTESSNDALESVNKMIEVQPRRNGTDPYLFMSTVARKTDVLGGVVKSSHDPELAKSTPIRNLSSREVVTDRAHLAYINNLTSSAKTDQPKLSEEEKLLSNLRQDVGELAKPAVEVQRNVASEAPGFAAINDQFALGA